MKKILLTLVLIIGSSSITYSQTDNSTSKKKTQFGISVGYVSAIANAKVDVDGISVNSSESVGGVLFGVSANTFLSNKVSLQPSAHFAIIDDENFLFVPVMLKYYLEDKLNLMAGPQGTFSFGDKAGLPINTFGLDLGVGIGYDINTNFYAEARYAFELTNRTPDPIAAFSEGFDSIVTSFDVKTRLNSFHLNVGYRFN